MIGQRIEEARFQKEYSRSYTDYDFRARKSVPEAMYHRFEFARYVLNKVTGEKLKWEIVS